MKGDYMSNNRARLCALKTAMASVVFSSLFVFASATCAQQPKQITLLHTNDMHAHFTPAPATKDKPPIGGFVALDYYVKLQRKLAPNSLLLDAGDLMTGNLISDMEYNGAQGGALIEMMNMIGYDGRTFGNHDCDKLITNLQKMNALANFPTICANFTDSSGRDFTNEKYHIYNVNGLRVGVIGITYYPMAGMASPASLLGFNSTDPATAVNKIVPEIDSITDLIVVLSHIGIEADRNLAQKIKGVDVIIGGHSHTRLDQPEKVNGVLIVQAGSYANYLGRLELTVVGDSIENYTDTLIALRVKNIQPDPKLQTMVDSIDAIIEKQYGMAIGTLKKDWKKGREDESNVGDWLTDTIRKKTNGDAAFINVGGIRRDIPAGPVTLKDIKEMLPFDNYIATFECTGQRLIEILSANIGNEFNGQSHGALEVSGVSYTYKYENGRGTMIKTAIGGQVIDPQKKYKVATIDYIIDNADKYFGFVPINVKKTNLLLSDVIIEAIKEAGTIDSKTDGRIKKED
jgi:2',3'-cyclic-nucleotide 2'-phosphodiesterase (5'-nucleotidase family)